MDARIGQRLIELRKQKENERLWKARIRGATAQFKHFMAENKEAIAEIFELKKSKVLNFYNDQHNERCFYYSIEDGFHTRGFNHLTVIDLKFSDIEKLVEEYSETTEEDPETLIN